MTTAIGHRTAAFDRQETIFPARARQASSALILGCESSPLTARYLTAGLAMAGFQAIGLDALAVCGCGNAQGEMPSLATLSTDALASVLNPNVAVVPVDEMQPSLDLPLPGRVMPEESILWIFALSDGHNSALVQRQIFDVCETVPARRRRTALCTTGRQGLHVTNETILPGDGSTALSSEQSDAHPGIALAAAGLLTHLALTQWDDSNPSAFTAAYHAGLPNRSRDRRRGGEMNDALRIADLPCTETAPHTWVIVGAGALAQALLFGLHDVPRTLLPKELVIVDPDRIESTNRARQPLLCRADDGDLKTEAVVNEIQRLLPDTSCTSVAASVESPEDLDRIVEGRRPEDVLLISAPDNLPTRFVTSDWAAARGVVHATAGTDPAGVGVWVSDSSASSCLRCALGYGEAGADNTPFGRVRCSGNPDAAVVSTNMLAAGLLCSEMMLTLSRSAPRNLRFYGGEAATPGLNRIRIAATPPPCRHQGVSA